MMVNSNGLYLVGGLEPWNFIFRNILNNLIPTDELIVFKMVETTSQKLVYRRVCFKRFQVSTVDLSILQFLKMAQVGKLCWRCVVDILSQLSSICSYLGGLFW